MPATHVQPTQDPFPPPPPLLLCRRYHQPVLTVTTGVHCLDRAGCVPPQDHTPTAAEDAAWAAQGLCAPDWWCCDWESAPNAQIKGSGGLFQATGGASGFVAASPPGSWVARLGLVGHT